MWCTNRLLWHTNSDFYGVRTPLFMPYEPFLLGVGVVFDLLKQQEIPGTPAGTPVCPAGCSRRPGRCPWDFSYAYLPFAFLRHLKMHSRKEFSNREALGHGKRSSYTTSLCVIIVSLKAMNQSFSAPVFMHVMRSVSVSISLSLSVPACLPACLPASLSLSLSLSVCLCLSLSLSLCLSVSLCLSLSLYLSICLSLFGRDFCQTYVCTRVSSWHGLFFVHFSASITGR